MSACDPRERCITCGDVGVEMVVLRVEEYLALCEGDGGTREVEVGLIDPVTAGDTVLVHADVALVRL